MEAWTGAAILSLIGLFNIFGTLTMGFLGDKYSKKFLNLYGNKVINIHPSLLPKFKGLNTYSRILKNTEVIDNEYLSKLNLYCLINDGRSEEAQLIFDLKKELGFKDEYGS